MIAQESSKPLVRAEIPFRESPAVGGAQVMFVFSVTLLLLGAVWLVAQHARRNGWLDRWLSRQAGADSKPAAARILASRRISRLTTLHTVTDGNDRYLLVESKANVSMVRLHQIKEVVAGEGNAGD